MGFFSLSALLYVPILVAQWIGVIAIGKGRRSGGWWCMLIGLAFATLGGVAWPLVRVGISQSSLGSIDTMHMISLIGLLSTFGSLLFMVGFAMHALGFRRVCERVSELEMVIEAQNEQLGRQS